ncbi:trypsin-like peptidase domain-containing protein [Candidatus Peregrinibacteria bacterium]|nr:trypsin-like peptidase domain-containing protein [Candidatus Peregrinibacteria bacterium]
MENSSKNLAILVGLAFVFGLVGAFVGDKLFVTNVYNGKLIEDHTYIEDSQIISAIKKVDPAVVSIVTSDTLDPKSLEIPAQDDLYGGTGFIVDKSGLIFTNKHVLLSKKADYKVILNDNSEYLAKFLSEDPFDDVAVLKIQNDKKIDFPVVTFGNSDNLVVGQRVVAIGNALAVYGNTVTSGIISAKGRDVVAYNDYGAVQNLSGLIQTDAAINLGNSGGPLIDLDGQVVAMNSAVQESANNIGFAIPINDLKSIISSVKKNGEIVRPVLGVNFVMLDKGQAKDINKSLDHGALLVESKDYSRPAIEKGGAADRAGLKDMDVVVSVENVDVMLENPLHKIIRNYNPGDTVALKVWRNGKIITVKVTLKSNKDK